MNLKTRLLFCFFLVLGGNLQAQEHAFDLVCGAIYPLRIDKDAGNATPKTGLIFGVLYRKKNEKGVPWSIGGFYQLLQNKTKVQVNNQEETQTEKFEVFQVEASPLVWLLGKKQRGFVELGGFLNYLLHEETELKGNLVNNTKLLQRTSIGPSLGIGVQLGETMRKSFIIGLRDDYGAFSIGKTANGNKAKPLKFNTICLYIGLGI